MYFSAVYVDISWRSAVRGVNITRQMALTAAALLQTSC